MRQTTIAKPRQIHRKWYLIDAQDQTLGRLATFVASYLRGKHKTDFTPHVDMGDCIIVINAAKVGLSPEKEIKKLYHSHSGYPGGLKTINARDLRARHPIRLVEKAVHGMLPHTKLGRKQRLNLYVYPNEQHKHWAQNPQQIEVK
ncbi:uncharacterized protein LOC111627167 [Centruroides sculpturatus]|uniref:uncharacterized protein LOC111627167 n=1 Tax=Centruroides sculpturatus TaxID=218467 RepID=UPI000C6D7DDF|nr:uncharacterized protein LOC111627167 [Centruroides sculpturatus]